VTAIGDDVDPIIPVTVAIAAGVVSTVAFTPIFMQLDRYVVTGKVPGWLGVGGEVASPHRSSVVREAVAVSLLHDTMQVVMPAVIAAAVGPGPLATVCSWTAAAMFLKPVEAVGVVMATRDVGAMDALAWLRANHLPSSAAGDGDKDDDGGGDGGGAGRSWLGTVPALWRAVPVELAVTGATGGLHIALLVVASLLE
jgi:hypothetical protein